MAITIRFNSPQLFPPGGSTLLKQYQYPYNSLYTLLAKLGIKGALEYYPNP